MKLRSPFCVSQYCVFGLILIYVSITDALFEGCDHTYSLNAGTSYLESPSFPSNYPTSTSCRYKFVAPLDYTIKASCALEMDKGTNACSTEFFYISTDGDTLLRGSEQFCGNGNFDRQSVFRQLVLAYASYGGRGRFRCTFTVAPQACNCGWTANTRIVNGVNAGLNEYPHMVALRNLAGSQSPYCGGAIISHRYVLTAAHCAAVQPTASNILILAGDHNLQSSTESLYAAQYRVSAIYPHSGYVADPVNNDIALLLTATNIEWSRGVGPICLPPTNKASTTFAYNNVDVIGWGTTSFSGAVSSTLQKVNLMIVENSVCQRQYANTVIYNSQICTYDSSGSSRDSCQYDSGGPVILRSSRMFLLGLISFGNVCGQGGYAMGVNTRITSYLSWISQYTSTCAVSM